jgi:hypothetical protein
MLNKNLLALPLSLLVALPAMAGISKNVSVEDALEGRVAVVVAAEGGGTNLDFSELDEDVLRVAIDDPSKIMIDFQTGMPMVRLFRANIATKDLPAVKTTQLSVTTKDREGRFHLYIFPVTASSKPATYTKFLIGGVTRKRGSNTIATAVIGKQVAQQNKTLVDPKLKARVAHYVQLRSSGMSDRKAATKAKISMALAQKLDSLGESAPITQAVPVRQSVSIPVGPSPIVPIPKGKPQPPIETVPLPPSDPVSVTQVKPATTIASSPKIATAPQKLDGQVYAGALLKGLNLQRLKGHIPYRSNKWYRVNGSIRALKRGKSLDYAIAISGLKKQRFLELLSDGGLKL